MQRILSRRLARVERWSPRLYCTDDWAAYAELIPHGRLFVGKEETHGIERDHARQRHWPARFRRRTCVVSTTKRMVDASIALFVRFADGKGGVHFCERLGSAGQVQWLYLKFPVGAACCCPLASPVRSGSRARAARPAYPPRPHS